MTWAEYILRVDGYLRQQKRQAYRDRRTWYNTLVAPHLDPKKLPKSEQAYMKIDGEEKRKPKVSEETGQRYIEAMRKYLLKKKASNGDQ